MGLLHVFLEKLGVVLIQIDRIFQLSVNFEHNIVKSRNASRRTGHHAPFSHVFLDHGKLRAVIIGLRKCVLEPNPKILFILRIGRSISSIIPYLEGICNTK